MSGSNMRPVALELLRSGGHWWEIVDAEPPEWWLEQYNNFYYTAKPKLQESAESGPIPPEVPWSEMVAYTCSACHDDCINHRSTAAASAGECRICVNLPI